MLVFIDTETGGLDPQIHSLLSLGMVAINYSVQVPYYWTFSLDNYNCTQEALNINHLDIEELRRTGKKECQIAEEFLAAIQEIELIDGEKITLAGHNVSFDINFLKEFLKRNNISFHKHFHYRSVDTASILRYLYDKGVFPEKFASLETACKILGVANVQTHNAIDDAYLTYALYQRLLQL